MNSPFPDPGHAIRVHGHLPQAGGAGQKGSGAFAREDLMASDLVFQDPYLLDFLGLKDTLSERDPESANSPEAGEVPAGSGQRLRLRSQAKAHDRRRPKCIKIRLD